jgi:hypothetical protein
MIPSGKEIIPSTRPAIPRPKPALAFFVSFIILIIYILKKDRIRIPYKR